MLSASAGAASLDFSYNPNPDTEDYTVFGYNKKETYDVAIRIQDPALTGTSITAMKVFLPVENEWVENLSGWLSSELKLENKVNAPDIASCQATLADRFLSVTFDQPYTITEEGVYVGYSFTVKQLADYSNYPIAGVKGDNPDGLYVHSSRTRLKWTSEVAAKELVSAMVVTLQTDGGPTDAAAALPAESYIVAGEKGLINLDIINYGTEQLTSFGYSWDCNGESGSGSASLATPLQPGERVTQQVEAGPLSECGLFALSMSIDTFNGQPNGDPRKNAEGNLLVMPFMTVTRPLVEEYTGLRCQYCPRGYVAMEQMNEDFGDRFVGLAYHTETYESNAMVVMPDSEFPIGVSGYPHGSLNRSWSGDPSEIPAKWDAAAAITSPANVDVTLGWADESHTILEANASYHFARAFDKADMNVLIMLVADGLTNPAWYQINAFNGQSDRYTGPVWDLFTKGGNPVWDLIFNDVVVSRTDTKGMAGIIPEKIAIDDKIDYSVRFDINAIKNLQDEYFINEGATLKAVAVLIDKASGAAINSNKSASVDFNTSGIASATEDSSETVSTEYYDILGRRVFCPAKGTTVIRIDRKADGSTVSSKRIF